MATLIDEVVSRIRSVAGGPFGDDGSDDGCKVFSDFAPAVDLPYAIVYEVGEGYRFMSRGPAGIPYIADGRLHVDIYADDREQARQLGALVFLALDDCEKLLNPAEGPVFMIRAASAHFTPYAEVGPGGSATVFLRNLNIHYEQQRIIGNG